MGSYLVRYRHNNKGSAARDTYAFIYKRDGSQLSSHTQQWHRQMNDNRRYPPAGQKSLRPVLSCVVHERAHVPLVRVAKRLRLPEHRQHAGLRGGDVRHAERPHPNRRKSRRLWRCRRCTRGLRIHHPEVGLANEQGDGR